MQTNILPVLRADLTFSLETRDMLCQPAGYRSVVISCGFVLNPVCGWNHFNVRSRTVIKDQVFLLDNVTTRFKQQDNR